MNPITVSIETLRRAAPKRRDGYMETCLRLGKLSADGKNISFTRNNFLKIRRIFNPRAGVTILNPGCC
jgi:hypothetical protein